MKIDITKQRKVVITVATTGGLHGKEANPNLPEQPDEIVRAMKEAYDAGASVAHIHVRDRDGLTTADLGVYREVIQGIVETCPGMITQVGNGIGMRFENGRNRPGVGFTQEQRMNLLNITPRPDMLTVNAGSFHFQHKHSELLFDNPKLWNAEFIRGCNERDIHTELECYDVSHIENMIKLRDLGILKGPLHFSLVLGIDGGMSASPRNLMSLVDAMPDDSGWQVVTIGKHQTPLSMIALGMGAHIRVGFEDNVYIDQGVLAKNNAQFVERAVRLVRELGHQVATPAEARAMMDMHAEHRR